MQKKQPPNHHIYLIRHGNVDVPKNVCYGQLDCGVALDFNAEQSRLSDYFVEQACLEAPLNASPLIISSPLKRCYLLAQGLKKALASQNSESNVELQVNGAFKEINFGDWEGRTWEGIGQEKVQCWSDDLLNYVFPKGESTSIFHERVINAWSDLMAQLALEKEAKKVIIIAHAGVIRSILSHFLHIPLQNSLLLNIDKMSASHLNISPQYETLSRCVFINKVL